MTRRGLVRWVGAAFAHHSLSYVNRELCSRLVERDVDLEIVSVDPAEPAVLRERRFAALAARVGVASSRAESVHVRHQWPPDLVPPSHGAWVMCQPWELGGLPAAWVAPMRDEVDEIWTYTTWLRDCYVESGVPAEKMQVIPLGVDTGRFRPDGPTFPLDGTDRFRFLFVGGTIGRKGIDVLLRAYLAAFTADDDVTLVIKGSGTSTFYAGSGLHEQLAEIRRHPRAPAIEYLDVDLEHADLAALYRTCDALVHPYRGEGFGLPIAEAMASGLPVVVTGYGACLDFCNAETAYLLPARTVPVPSSAELPACDVGYWWAEPDVGALAGTMRRLVDDPGAAAATGGRGRDAVLRRCSWDAAAELVASRLEVLADRSVGRRPAPSKALVAPAMLAPAPRPSPSVSIVIAAQEQATVLERCLVALAPTVPEGSGRQVVVVDAGSTDGTAALLDCLEGDVVTAVCELGTSATVALQRAVALADSDVVVLLDPRVEVDRHWLEHLLSALAEDGCAAVAAGDGAVVAARRAAVDEAGGLDVALDRTEAVIDLCRRLEVRGGRVEEVVLEAAAQRGPMAPPSARFETRWQGRGTRRAIVSGERGVNVVGFFRGEFGVGEAGRLLAAAVDRTGQPYGTVTLSGTKCREDHEFEPVGPQDVRYDTTVVCANADALAHLEPGQLTRRMQESHTVGYWFWETERFPDRLHAGFDVVDEVWAGSTFTQRAIQQVAPVPVHALPPPVRPARAPVLRRMAAGLPDEFTFLFMFDFLSVMERKNPLAVIEAYRRAFGPGDGVALVIKSVNGDGFPDQLARLHRAAAMHPGVHVVDGYLSSPANHALLAHCDAYVSLHCAEGFGLSMAEAMAHGKPVIATAYSGNLDFMDDGNSVLVPYDLVDIPASARGVFPDGRWAEADRGAAAEAMQRVVTDRGWSAALGRRAADDVTRQHSIDARAAEVAALLDRSRQRVS